MAVSLRIVSVSQLVLSVASIVVSSLTLYYAHPNIKWPIQSAVGIWGAIFPIISASLAFAALSDNRPACCRPKSLFHAHFIINLLFMIAIMWQYMSYTIQPLIACYQNPVKEPYCTPNGEQIRILSICAVVIATLLFVLSIAAMATYRMTLGGPCGRSKCDVSNGKKDELNIRY